MKDRKNLQAVLSHIIFVLDRAPETFDMSCWVTETECGVTACIGGWARILEAEQTGVDLQKLTKLPFITQAKRAADFLGLGAEPWEDKFREDFNIGDEVDNLTMRGWDYDFDLLFILPLVVASYDEMLVSAEDLAVGMMKYLINNPDKCVYDAAKIFLFDPLSSDTLSEIVREEFPLYY